MDLGLGDKLQVKRFSSTVSHVQLDAVDMFDGYGSRGMWHFGSATCRVGWVGGAWDSVEVAIDTRMVEGTNKAGNGVSIVLYFCEDVIVTVFAEVMVEVLRAWVARL